MSAWFGVSVFLYFSGMAWVYDSTTDAPEWKRAIALAIWPLLLPVFVAGEVWDVLRHRLRKVVKR